LQKRPITHHTTAHSELARCGLMISIPLPKKPNNKPRRKQASPLRWESFCFLLKRERGYRYEQQKYYTNFMSTHESKMKSSVSFFLTRARGARAAAIANSPAAAAIEVARMDAGLVVAVPASTNNAPRRVLAAYQPAQTCARSSSGS
jgi:hypothetical protein